MSRVVWMLLEEDFERCQTHVRLFETLDKGMVAFDDLRGSVEDEDILYDGHLHFTTVDSDFSGDDEVTGYQCTLKAMEIE